MSGSIWDGRRLQPFGDEFDSHTSLGRYRLGGKQVLKTWAGETLVVRFFYLLLSSTFVAQHGMIYLWH